MQFRLVVEAGSTKTNWFFITDHNCQHRFSTKGINPTTFTPTDDSVISNEINTLLQLTKSINYYGAGITNTDKENRIKLLFSKYSIEEVNVYSDVLAAARATCGKEEGVVVIMGTGSNVSYFDGTQVHSITPSLGYILGDDGGGSAVGKQLLRAYFYNRMPSDISESFRHRFNLDKNKFIDELYSSEMPAKYLGQFAKFLSETKTEWGTEFIINIFEDFVTLHLANFLRIKELPINFVGSVAFYFRNELELVCKKSGMKIGQIMKSPDIKLIEYHINSNE